MADGGRSDEAAYERVWLYFSGGGLRAALGSLGVVWFLTHEMTGRMWDSVTRVSSVSGGSVENAALMTDPDIDAHVRMAFRRFTGHGRVLPYLRVLASTALWFAVGTAIAVWAGRTNGWFAVVLWSTVVLVGLATLQHLVTAYTRARLVGIATGRGRDPADTRLHLFAAADTRSGLPVYFASRHDEEGNHRTVLAHDRRAERSGVEFFDVAARSPGDVAFASSRWPLLHKPDPVTGERSPVQAAPAPAQPFRIEQAAEFSGDPHAGRFNLLDGGLTGTLGTRLDPRLFGLDGTGVMGTITWDGDDGTDDTPDRDEPTVRRVVVDGAKYMTSNRWYLVHRLPGLGGFMGLGRAITVSLDSQITLDRDLADDQPSVWYIPVTGHGRRQPLKYDAQTRISVVGQGRRRSWTIRALDRLDIMRRAANHEAVVLDDLATLGSEPERRAALDTIALIERLRFMADATSYFRRLRQRGLACAASGVANAFVEAEGLSGNHDRLLALLDEFTIAVRQRGALDDVLDPDPALVYRWPELRDLHQRGASTYWVSHRGDRRHRGPDQPKARGNTRAAFEAAYARGVRVFECDVQAVRSDGRGSPDVLVGLHTAFGWHLHGIRPRAVWRMTLATLQSVLDDGEPVDTIADLLTAFPDVTWNVEAKRRRSMRALLRTLDELDAAGALPDRPVIVSGGMRKRTLRLAREGTARPLMTAATFFEKVRLFVGRRTPHIAVVQLPAWSHRLTSRVVREAAAQRIHVQWFGVKRPGQVARLQRRVERCGFSTDHHELVDSAP